MAYEITKWTNMELEGGHMREGREPPEVTLHSSEEMK
jgi:hypothetical protein